jgi:hypothetical protein
MVMPTLHATRLVFFGVSSACNPIRMEEDQPPLIEPSCIGQFSFSQITPPSLELVETSRKLHALGVIVL